MSDSCRSEFRPVEAPLDRTFSEPALLPAGPVPTPCGRPDRGAGANRLREGRPPRPATLRPGGAGASHLLLALLLAAALAACGSEGGNGSATGGPGGGRHPGGRPGGPGGEARAAAGPPVSVAVSTAELGSISTYYQATASLEARNEADVQARVSGTVVEMLAEEGDEVPRGRALLRIDAREYRLRAEQAEAQLAKEQNRFERAKKMFEQNLVSEQEFTTAESDLKTAEASLALAELDLSYTSVVAPFSGRITRRLTDVGRTVSPGDALFALADVHPLLARVHVPAKEFRSLRTDQEVALVLGSDGTELRGRISLISPVIDPNTGTIKVTIEVDDYPPGTRPGDFAEVRIVTERREDVLLVPKIAVVSEKGEQYVYVPVDSVAVRREVEVGFEDEAHAQIVRGLDAGERVVIQGQRSLKDGSPIRILEPLQFRDEPGAGGASS